MSSRSCQKKRIYGEFLLRGQNTKAPPLCLRWRADESLYYGGHLEVLSGPTSIRTRFERRIADLSWMRNDPNKIAGGRPFTESFYTTVAVLMAFADSERLAIETVHSPVPMTSSTARHLLSNSFSDLEDLEREKRKDFGGGASEGPNPNVAGTINAG